MKVSSFSPFSLFSRFLSGLNKSKGLGSLLSRDIKYERIYLSILWYERGSHNYSIRSPHFILCKQGFYITLHRRKGLLVTNHVKIMASYTNTKSWLPWSEFKCLRFSKVISVCWAPKGLLSWWCKREQKLLKRWREGKALYTHYPFWTQRLLLLLEIPPRRKIFQEGKKDERHSIVSFCDTEASTKINNGIIEW